jgi:hypothetical protein
LNLRFFVAATYFYTKKRHFARFTLQRKNVEATRFVPTNNLRIHTDPINYNGGPCPNSFPSTIFLPKTKKVSQSNDQEAFISLWRERLRIEHSSRRIATAQTVLKTARTTRPYPLPQILQFLLYPKLSKK